MNIEEIREKFPDEWVLIEFTDLDEEFNVVRGSVVTHSKSRNEIERALAESDLENISVEFTGAGDSEEAYLI